MFGIALLIVLVLPLAVTAIAYERAKAVPQPVPVTRWRTSPRPRKPRDPGYTWGVGLGILAPYAVAGVLHVAHAPEGTGALLFLSAVLACWTVHFFMRRRTNFFGAVPWGMVLGTMVLPLVIGLILVPVAELFGL